MKKIIEFIKNYWITALLFLGLYFLYVYLANSENINNLLFPPVSQIISAFGEVNVTFLHNMMGSFGLMIPSLLIALIIALALGTIMGLSPFCRRVLYPIIYTVSVVPSILLSPFALVLAPNFKMASIFLIAYNIIWPTLFATINGIITIDRVYLDIADTLEIKGIKRLFKVLYPAAMPSIFSGLVTSIRGTFLVLVFAEMYGTQLGMGYFVKKYTDYGMYDYAWAGLIFMILILLIVMLAFEKAKERTLRWTINDK